MKSAALPLLAVLLAQPGFAQFWLVSDKDGYVNVRGSANAKSRIGDTLHNGHFVFLLRGEEQSGNWIKIQYNHPLGICEGYVFRDRLKPISFYDSVPLRTKQDNTATYTRDSIRVIVTQQKFDKTKYRISYGNGHMVSKINGKPYCGTDGEIPKREYKSIVIQAGSRMIVLPHAVFDNLFEPTIDNMEICYDRIDDIFYIHAENGDGAGAYDVIWRVVKGVYTDQDIELDF